MNINITSLLHVNAWPLSHSIAEGGESAGRDTWENAKTQALKTELLDTDEKREAFKDWIADFGAWNKEEREAMTSQELNALFLQFIAGDLREMEADTLANLDWEAYEEEAAAGRISDYMSRDYDGQIYFSLQH